MSTPITIIRWNDAQDHPSKWVDESDALAFGESSCEIISVGFLISKTAKYLTIGGDWDAVDKDYGRVTKIPIGMIISVESIEIPSSETPV